MNRTDLTAHLLRRAGFGPTATELEHATINGFFATVDTLIGGLGQPDTGADTVQLSTLTEPPTDLRVGAAPFPSSIRDSIGTFLPANTGGDPVRIRRGGVGDWRLAAPTPGRLNTARPERGRHH